MSDRLLELLVFQGAGLMRREEGRTLGLSRSPSSPAPRYASRKAKGWKVGTVDEFLPLTSEEATYVDLKLALSRRLREYRQAKRLTQVEMAKLLKSSQSRVAKIETGDASVSLDLLIRALIALGATRRELGRMIAM
jgi:DNA-binding XRE family transcriptional regulator